MLATAAANPVRQGGAAGPAHLAAQYHQARVEHDADGRDPDRDAVREFAEERLGHAGLPGVLAGGQGGLGGLGRRLRRESVLGRELAHRAAAGQGLETAAGRVPDVGVQRDAVPGSSRSRPPPRPRPGATGRPG